jgi:hypothetical protein
VLVYDVTCGCGGEYVIVDYVEVPEHEAPEDGSYYAQDGDDCEGETSESVESADVESTPSSDEGCGSDTSETASGSDETAEGDTDCGSDTSETAGDDGGGDDGGDDGGDTDGGSSEEGSGCEGDDGGSGEDSGCDCGGDSGLARSAARPPVRTSLRARPRLSVMALGLVLLVAPLRRLTRPRRDAR